MFVYRSIQSEYICDVGGNIHVISIHVCIHMYVFLACSESVCCASRFCLSNWYVNAKNVVLVVELRTLHLSCARRHAFTDWAAMSRDLDVVLYKSQFVRLKVILISASDQGGPQHCYWRHTLNTCSALPHYTERTVGSEISHPFVDSEAVPMSPMSS